MNTTICESLPPVPVKSAEERIFSEGWKEKDLTKTPSSTKKRSSLLLPYTPWPEDQPLPQSFVVLDMETTGLNPEQNHIIEIACIRVREGVITEQYHCLVQCDNSLPKQIIDLTGLNDQKLKDTGVPLFQAITELLTFLSDDWIVGHNTAFDIRFLLAACIKLNIRPPSFHAIDTYLLAKKHLHNCVANYRLETLAQYYHLAERQTHRALPDALLTTRLFLKLKEND